MNNRRNFSADQLREIVEYNPDTGVFRWLPRSSPPAFNANYAGKEAGSIFLNESGRKYKVIQIYGQRYGAHRLAYIYMTGKWPNEYIDHVDGDSLNNVWSNLRPANAAQNSANAKRYRSNTSGLKGVSYAARHGKWRAAYGRVWLGNFATKEEAHEAYMTKARELHGDFARAE
jgi:hypothetical protein